MKNCVRVLRSDSAESHAFPVGTSSKCTFAGEIDCMYYLVDEVRSRICEHKKFLLFFSSLGQRITLGQRYTNL